MNAQSRQFAPVRDDRDAWGRLAQECSHGATLGSDGERSFSECHANTRVALLNSLREKAKGDDRGIIWLSGESGSGKSAVAHTLAQQLRSDDMLAAAFFFSRKDANRSNPDRLIFTISYQLGLHHPRAKEVIIKAISDDPALLSAEKSRREQIEKLVVLPLQCLAPHWKGRSMSMLWDALDEGETGKNDQLQSLLRTFVELIVKNPTLPISHIIITSRPWSQIKAAMQHKDLQGLVTQMQMEDFDAKEDVEHFLRSSFATIYRSRGLSSTLPSPWPTEAQIAALLQRTDARFITAATMVRLIDHDEANDQLSLVLGMFRGKGPRKNETEGVYVLYHSIISSVDSRTRAKSFEYLASVVALVRPLTLPDLHSLFGVDLRPFLSVFSAVLSVPPPGSKDPVQLYHESLRDFIKDPDRSAGFYVSPDEIHRKLTCACLTLMIRDLKQDICDLKDPSLLLDEIADLEDRRASAITPALHYACTNWVYHLENAPADDEIQQILLDFLQQKLLFMIEVLGIYDELGSVIQSFIKASKIVQRWDVYDTKDLSLSLLNDARRIVLEFYEVLRSCPLHLYQSALPLSPLKSQLRHTYGQLLSEPQEISVEQGLDDNWDHIIYTIDVPSSSIQMLTISSDDSRIAIAANQCVIVYETLTGAAIAGKTDWYNSDLRFSPADSAVLAYCTESFDWKLWDTSNDTSISLQHDRPFRHADPPCAFSHDGLKIACGLLTTDTQTAIHIWSTREPYKLVLVIPLPAASRLSSLAYSRAGDQLMASHAEKVTLLDPANGAILKTIDYPISFGDATWPNNAWHFFSPEDAFTVHVDLSPDADQKSPLFCTAWKEGRAILRDAHQATKKGGISGLVKFTKKVVLDEALPSVVPFQRVIDSRTRIPTNKDVLQLRKGNELVALKIGPNFYCRWRDTPSSGDGSYALFAGWRTTKDQGKHLDNRVHIIDLPQLAASCAEDIVADVVPLHRLAVYGSPPRPMVFSRRDTKEHLVIVEPLSLRTIDVPPGFKCYKKTHQFSMSWDMQMCACVEDQERVRLCAITLENSLRHICSIKPARFPTGKFRTLFSPSSDLLAVIGMRIQIWDTASGKMIGETNDVSLQMRDCVAFSPDGSKLAWTQGWAMELDSVIDKPTIKVLSLESGKKKLKDIVSLPCEDGIEYWDPTSGCAAKFVDFLEYFCVVRFPQKSVWLLAVP